MCVLLLTPDDDAADALCAALTRLGEISAHVSNSDQVDEACARLDPLVIVIDATAEGYLPVLDKAREVAWRRILLLLDPHTGARAQPLVPAIEKPFDASEIAALLGRERQLADADRRERTAQRQAREYALLVEASFEAIIGLCHDGTIVSWNPGAQQIYGYSAAEAMGRHVSLLDPEPSQTAGPPQLVHAIEARRRHKDGREVMVLLSRSRVETSDETQLSFAEVSLDVTARHELERELEHSKRLATIGRLSASMSHEINNPLTVVHASATWIRERAEHSNDPALQDAASDIEVAAERIAQFSEQVCGFARRNQTQVRAAPLGPTVDLALRMVKPRASERRVTVNCQAELTLEVPHDATRLAQVLINVLANAIDAAAEGGGNVVLRTHRDEQQLCIEVDDDGPGIAEEIRDQLFQPFSTTKPFGKGTGLGLALSRKILEDHRGSIELVAIPQGGTRAEIRLPNVAHKLAQPLNPKAQPHA